MFEKIKAFIEYVKDADQAVTTAMVTMEMERLNKKIRKIGGDIPQVNVCLGSIEVYLGGKTSFEEPYDRKRMEHLYQEIGEHPGLSEASKIGLALVKMYKPF